MPIISSFAVLTAEEIALAEAAKIAAQIAAEEAATQAAMQLAQQEAARIAAEQATRVAAEQAAQQTAQQGITQIAQNTAPEITQIAQNSTMTPAQQAYMQASNANAAPGIAQGTVPLQPAGAPPVGDPTLTARGITNTAVQDTAAQNAFREQAANNAIRTTVPNAPVNPYSPINANYTVGPPQAGNVVPSGGPPSIKAAGLPPAPSGLSKGYQTVTDFMVAYPNYTAAGAYLGASKLGLFDPKKQTFNDDKYDGPLSRYQMSSDFEGRHVDPTQYQYTPRYASGGIMGAAPVERMSNNAAMGTNTMYPMANMATSSFATPYQTPQSTNMLANMTPSGGGTVDAMSGEPNMQGTRMAEGGQVPGYASGGFFKNVFGDAAQLVGDAGAGVGQFVNNLGQGRVSIGRPESDQTADQIAKKYYTNTAPAQNVNPQQYQYSPQYAEGGVTKYAKGNLTSSLDYYTNMLGGESERQIAEASRPVGGKGDAGIARDTDPDTAYLSAAEAAAVRMGKVNAKANMQGLTLPRPKPINRINLKPQGVKQAEASASLDPEMAASGGIMGASHLGGYAAGGNPRLLKGPGDGMSDNIPAVIGQKQPARLADGEFVIPADVVSHLGNGSTEAGAKKLHDMMNKVRKARTGNSKQGKQINPNKFIPR